MLKLSLPKDQILKRALLGFITFVLALITTFGLASWDDALYGQPTRGIARISQAIQMYGPDSQEIRDAMAQIGDEAVGQSIFALVDPTTGTAVAAYPPEMEGKKPEEMVLPWNVRLPSLAVIRSRGRIVLEPPKGVGKRVEVRTSNFYANSGYGRLPASPMGPMPLPTQAQRELFLAPSLVLVTVTPIPEVRILPVLGTVTGILAFLGFALYWLSMAWWVFDDGRKRSNRAPLAWGALTLLTNLVGVIVYLIARTERAECPTCGTPAERSFSHCPNCGRQLKQDCVQCGAPLTEGWKYCAKCGHPRDSSESDLQAK